jgi:hypothetical protein
MKQRAKQDAEINQTFCLHATSGDLWMRGHFDKFPAAVRQRLRNSPFNLCAWCLGIEVMPTVRRQHPNWTRERLLLAAVELMERKVRAANK